MSAAWPVSLCRDVTGAEGLFSSCVKTQSSKRKLKCNVKGPPTPPQSKCLMVRVFTPNLTGGDSGFCEAWPLGEVWVLLACKLRRLAESQFFWYM